MNKDIPVGKKMTDKEKIAEIIKKNGTYNGRSLSFDYYVVQPDDLATALIENDIGDIIEWKRRAGVAERACRIATDKIYDYCYEEAIAQAERELTEEKKE